MSPRFNTGRLEWVRLLWRELEFYGDCLKSLDSCKSLFHAHAKHAEISDRTTSLPIPHVL